MFKKKTYFPEDPSRCRERECHRRTTKCGRCRKHCSELCENVEDDEREAQEDLYSVLYPPV